MVASSANGMREDGISTPNYGFHLKTPFKLPSDHDLDEGMRPLVRNAPNSR